MITKEVYARAEQFLPWNAYKLIFNSLVQPHWIENTDKFWYVKINLEKKEFILVDPTSNEIMPAFDHKKLAESISKATGKSYNHEKLPFDDIIFGDGRRSIQFTIGKKRWSCNLESYQCKEIKKKENYPSEGLISPDGKWAAFLRDYNLYVRSHANGQEIQLTSDGEPFNDYGTSPESNTSTITLRRLKIIRPPIAIWSPDSKKLLTHKIDQRKVKEMYLIQSVGLRNSSRPILHSYRYPLPEDEERALVKFVILDIERENKIDVVHEPQETNYLSPIESKLVWWSKDSKRAYFIHIDRGYKTVKLKEINGQTGSTRTIVEEKESTHVDLSHLDENKPVVWILNKNNEIIWFSQRDGWGHLYLYDGNTGSLKNQIMSGNWLVHEIVYVDEKNRYLYFIAGGREANRDPYYRHLYRVSLDGKDLKLLTPEDANHNVVFSPTGNYFIDNFSRVDSAPSSILRAIDGQIVRELEQANVNLLIAKGWKWPERFSVKARDNKTDLYGIIFFPTTFNHNKKYPVIDSIYPGPQRINTPKSFHTRIDMNLLGFWEPQALAEIGFIVVIVDGLGTPLRSKTFLDFSFGNMGDAGGLEDHVVAIRQLAKNRPYMDISQVGIYGHSGGGFASARAILSYPDFYKVAVSSAGNHDQRGYIADWGERYQGLLNGDNYLNQVNDKLAKNLKGKLLLACGDLDDNVHPALTFQLADALIKANKDFDLLVLPNRNHYFLIDEYFIRKKWDYFVEHLLGENPPKEYKIKPPKMEFILNLASQLA